MLCLVVIAIGAFAFFKVMRHRYAWGPYAYCGSPFGSFGSRFWDDYSYPWGRVRGRFRRAQTRLARRGARRWLEALFERLDTSPRQERTILEAMDKFWDHLTEGRGELSAVRKQVAQVLASDQLDEGALSAALERVEDLIAKTKQELASVLTEVHSSLDSEQRKELADILSAGPYRRDRDFGRL